MFIIQIPAKENFQLLHINGQNDNRIRSLSINRKEFKHYTHLNKNLILKSSKKPVFERCEGIVSYFMLNLDGDTLVN